MRVADFRQYADNFAATKTCTVPMTPPSPQPCLDQRTPDAHGRNVEAHLDPGHSSNDAQCRVAGVDLATTIKEAVPISTPSSHHYALLGLAAANLDDVERTRIAVGNRIGAMEREGGGTLPEVERMRALLDALAAQEHGCGLTLARTLRAHPLGPWIKATIGIGEKQGARLIAAIGEPDWNPVEERPRRGPAELWAYCGLHTLPADQSNRDAHGCSVGGNNVAARRRKGQRANWNAVAKSRAYLVAESCMKQAHSPYRAVYDRERAKKADAIHDKAPCAPCGTKGNPAPIGSPWRDGHKHAHALRLVSKEILKDLWREARRLREETA